MIPGSPAQLAGTLLLPASEPPYSAMVLTHGSGPDTRSTGPYIGKAGLAVLSGLAVLVYDKRGAGQSTGSNWYRPERLTADALAMWRWLANNELINPDRVGIGGISQGGYIAPRAAFYNPDVAFLFTTSAPALSSAELNVFAMKNRLKLAGLDKIAVEDAVRGLRAVYRYYNTGVPALRDTAVAMIARGDSSWTHSSIFKRMLFSDDGGVPDSINVRNWDMMFFEPLMYWCEVQVPVLAVWGENDINVPATFSREAIGAALKFAGNEQCTLVVYPQAGHGISIENGPKGDFPRAAPGYVEIMARWFSERAE